MDPAAPATPRWTLAAPEGTPAEAFRLTDDTGTANLSYALHLRAMLGGLPFHRGLGWPTTTEDLPTDLPNLAYHGQVGRGEFEGLLTPEGLSVRVTLSDGRVWVDAAGRDRAEVDAFVARLRDFFPLAEIDPEEPRVSVTFWSLGPHGPNGRTRRLVVPPWEDVAGNYAEMARVELDRLMADDFEPGRGGQLHLWHGPPGTGKTYGLRALFWQWRKWCSVHYITDPETFFGKEAAYMLDVLLHDEDDGPVAPAAPDCLDEDQAEALEVDRRATEGRWRLLVLEDTGELMASDAKSRSGQGLSRLLNVVDGLIGQGLRILVLVTTNEELRNLHDAAARPGRCASKILFPALPREDALEWLTRQGVADPKDRLPQASTYPVSDLYALLDERETSADRSPARAGFTT